jgi:exodeoxyribonuclease VII small subunit
MNREDLNTLSFEEALRRLERVVSDLERGQLDLASSLASYEEGVALLGRCQALLDGVDRSVALLTGVEADGTPVVSAFDATASVDGLGLARVSARRPPGRDDENGGGDSDNGDMEKSDNNS